MTVTNRDLILLALFGLVTSKLQTNFRNLYAVSTRSYSHANPRIIGGHEAIPHSIPYQAFLELHSFSDAWHCGGSLISQNYILTAAHCGEHALLAIVRLGAHKPLQPEDTQVKLIATAIKVHEEWNRTEHRNDIAIIKLPKPVNITESINFVQLPSFFDAGKTFADEEGTVSGWGYTDGFIEELSDVLNVLNTTVISNEECLVDFDMISKQHVCITGVNKTGICEGDSGGPLTSVGEKQIGIASFGILFCTPGFASVFTRVTYFLNWIENNSDVQISRG